MWQQLKTWLAHSAEPSPGVAVGARGERLAAAFLQHKGFRVVARNWRDPRDRRDELDLICRDDDVLVFVEVKTRAAHALVPGFYAVDQRKKKVVRRTATAYLRALATRPQTVRFDVVEVAVQADGAVEVLHFENIALFPKGFRP
jgi:putative endonuclease